jgi:hypothetical protein
MHPKQQHQNINSMCKLLIKLIEFQCIAVQPTLTLQPNACGKLLHLCPAELLLCSGTFKLAQFFSPNLSWSRVTGLSWTKLEHFQTERKYGFKKQATLFFAGDYPDFLAGNYPVFLPQGSSLSRSIFQTRIIKKRAMLFFLDFGHTEIQTKSVYGLRIGHSSLVAFSH